MEGYLYIWLQSPFACSLIEAMSYGSVVPHIEIVHIRKIPVPILKKMKYKLRLTVLRLRPILCVMKLTN